MDFHEFFKKKRIDLTALEKAEPGLFSEFKTHYYQMGEKSFDHTKKYWFNKTRRRFPLAPEVKSEKPHIPNPLAEQTITESLVETLISTAPPKTGFTPRFKATVSAKLIEDSQEKPAEADSKATAPKPGFTPRFKASVTSKPVEINEGKSTEPDAPEPVTPKPGFTPRFKSSVTKPVESNEEKAAEPEVPVAAPSPKPGFIPRFKAGATKPVENNDEKVVEPDVPGAASPPKPGFTPRFKAGVTKPVKSDDTNLTNSERNDDKE